MAVALDGARSDDTLLSQTEQNETEWLNTQTHIEPTASTRLELVFIDENTPDYQILIEDLENDLAGNKQLEIVLIGADENGINRITETLSNFSNVDAVHLVSHGSDGTVNIGNTSLNSHTLLANEKQIALWGESFSEDGDLLIYGCNVSATDSGKELSATIASVSYTHLTLPTKRIV